MIIEALVRLLVTVVTALLSALPTVPVPAWVGSVTSGIAGLVGYANGLGAWVPMNFVLVVAGSVLACMAIGFAIKLVRIVASFLTAGGGSAA